MDGTSLTRRNLLAAAMAAGVGAVLASPAITRANAVANPEPAKDTMKPEYYELRSYHLRRGPMQKRLDDYLRDAFIPAAAKAVGGPIGVFGVSIGMNNPTTHVLIPHASLESFAALGGKLSTDADYAKSAEPFLAATPTEPGYESLDIKLMQAFPHMPRLELPAATAKKEPRIFELRTYRSHGERAGAKKVEMFDTAGEIAIFRRCGLTPVFFASDLTGPGLPSLTYMLTFPDLATREKSWNTFRVDPEWKKLSSTPGFTDPEIVVGIDNQVLSPTAYSQV
ncbi:NIPSNAP family protein [Humisphaera borealis]|uniref:NIPSNAP family protein n=1 Tax=Humisphaera borealis TaxID=2807512 RepID=A0A7M2WRL8_9BACT|nr:NIPSNAP family protein [Humisphaera borealis]QOV88158.1 NIPSNAP family protein [Humisphaera borealis]